LCANEIDAIYMPLPTGIHEEWITRTLEAGKHILVEKSFAPTLEVAKRLTDLARSKNLLIVENFLFPCHSQYKWIREHVTGGDLGKVSLFRSNFSIPKFKPGNFRYNAALGGGALLDLGAYLVKFTRLFLGNVLNLVGATLRYDKKLGVDMAGTATFMNKEGQIAQVAFDFDSYYQNNWEIIGNKAKLTTERAYTPPPNFNPIIRIERQNHREEYTLTPDNHYVNKLQSFVQAVSEQQDFNSHWNELENQAYYIDLIKRKAIRL